MNRFYNSGQSAHFAHKSLPPLKHRREFSTPSGTRRPLESETPIFSYLPDGQNQKPETSAHRFFTQDKARSSFNANRTLNLSIEEIPLKKMPQKSRRNWELVERLEAYELKSLKVQDFPRTVNTVVSQFGLWDACYNELLPIISKRSTQTSEVITKVHSNIQTLFAELKQSYDQQQVKFHKESLKMKRQIAQLEATALELQGASDDLLQVKRLQQEKIASQIEEIFGQDDDYIKFRQKTRRLQEQVQPTGATDLLKQIYYEMSKDQNIPEEKEFDFEMMDPDEIQTGIMHNFNTIQKSTATRVIKMIENRFSKVNVGTLTEEELVDKRSFDQLEEQYEKTQLQHQAATQQLENLRQDFNQKLVQVERLENERSGLNAEITKITREQEKLDREIKHGRKENGQLKDERDKLSGVIEQKDAEIGKLDEIGDRLRNKIKQFEEQIERNLGSIAQKETRIDELQKKLGNRKGVVSTLEEAPVVTKTKKSKKQEGDKDEWKLAEPEIDFMDTSKKKKRPARVVKEYPPQPSVNEQRQETGMKQNDQGQLQSGSIVTGQQDAKQKPEKRPSIGELPKNGKKMGANAESVNQYQKKSSDIHKLEAKSDYKKLENTGSDLQEQKKDAKKPNTRVKEAKIKPEDAKLTSKKPKIPSIESEISQKDTKTTRLNSKVTTKDPKKTTDDPIQSSKGSNEVKPETKLQPKASTKPSHNQRKKPQNLNPSKKYMEKDSQNADQILQHQDEDSHLNGQQSSDDSQQASVDENKSINLSDQIQQTQSRDIATQENPLQSNSSSESARSRTHVHEIPSPRVKIPVGTPSNSEDSSSDSARKQSDSKIPSQQAIKIQKKSDFGQPRKFDKPVRTRIPLGPKHPLSPVKIPDHPSQISEKTHELVDRGDSPIHIPTKKRTQKVSLEMPQVKHEMVDKQVSVRLLESRSTVETRSIGIYYNSEKPKSEIITTEQTEAAIYLLPFNPNNIYGLKGDNHYNGRVFQAQPTIPEMTDSLIFQGPYKMDTGRERSPM